MSYRQLSQRVVEEQAWSGRPDSDQAPVGRSGGLGRQRGPKWRELPISLGVRATQEIALKLQAGATMIKTDVFLPKAPPLNVLRPHERGTKCVMATPRDTC